MLGQSLDWGGFFPDSSTNIPLQSTRATFKVEIWFWQNFPCSITSATHLQLLSKQNIFKTLHVSYKIWIYDKKKDNDSQK